MRVCHKEKSEMKKYYAEGQVPTARQISAAELLSSPPKIKSFVCAHPVKVRQSAKTLSIVLILLSSDILILGRVIIIESAGQIPDSFYQCPRRFGVSW